MFWISGLMWFLGGMFLALALIVFSRNWGHKKKKYIRGPWKTNPSDLEFPDKGVKGELIRGPDSWWRNQNGGDTPYV